MIYLSSIYLDFAITSKRIASRTGNYYCILSLKQDHIIDIPLYYIPVLTLDYLLMGNGGLMVLVTVKMNYSGCIISIEYVIKWLRL
jgi:hypothetical protein